MAMQPFKFMDLPPELRLEVYKILLQINPQSFLGCYSEILATCRIIHNEAMHLLYSLNIIKVLIKAGRIHVSPYMVYALGTTGTQITRTFTMRTKERTKERIIDSAVQPTVLGRCQQIFIRIHLHRKDRNIEGYEELRRAVWWVCNALSANTSLKSVRVEDTTRIPSELVEETSLPIGFVLSPLRTIRGLEEVSIASLGVPKTMLDFTKLVMLGPREPPE